MTDPVKQVRDILEKNPKIADGCRNGWKLGVYPYYAMDGSLGHCVVTMTPPKKLKEKESCASVHLNDGKLQEGEPTYAHGRPLLGAAKLISHPAARVWIVGDENSAAALNAKFRKVSIDSANIAVTLGKSLPRDTDFRLLQGRAVTIWPNRDQDTTKIAGAIGDKLATIAWKTSKVGQSQFGEPSPATCADWLDKQSNITAGTLERLVGHETVHRGDLQWGDPQSLNRPLGVASSYPIDALGDVLAPAAKRMITVIQAPAAMVGAALLSAGALAVQGLCNIEIDGRARPTSLFFLTIGVSGERKSAVYEVAHTPILRHQHRLSIEHLKRQKQYELASMVYEIDKKRLLRAKSSADRKKLLKKMGAKPVPPAAATLICSDPTMEGLIIHLANGHPSIGVFSDEAGMLVGGYALKSEQARMTAGGFNSLWDGAMLNRVRASGAIPNLPGRRVSMHLMMQPNIAHAITSNRDLEQQGFVPRCLLAWPESNLGKRKHVKGNLNEDPKVQAYHRRLDALFQLPLPIKKGTELTLSPRSLTLSEKAYPIWVNFHDKIESQIGEAGRLRPISGLAAKAAEHASRLAAVLGMVNRPNCSSVDEKDLLDAIQIVEHHIEEALRICGVSAEDNWLRVAENTLRKLQAAPEMIVPLNIVYQKGVPEVRTAAAARTVMKVLVDHGWAQQVVIAPSKKGKPPMESYIIRKR